MSQVREIACSLKLDRQEERCRHVDSSDFSTSCISAARLNLVYPEGETGSVRFTIEKVEIVLPHEEGTRVDRIARRRSRVIVQDRYLRRVRSAQSDARAGRI